MEALNTSGVSTRLALGVALAAAGGQGIAPCAAGLSQLEPPRQGEHAGAGVDGNQEPAGSSTLHAPGCGGIRPSKCPY
jgi:hypothetical protein